MKNLFKRLKLEVKETLFLLRNVPAVMVTLFVVSVLAMNILAEYSLIPSGTAVSGILALDGGIFVSWLSFLGMDTIVKRFGAKASIRISVVATVINLVIFLIKALIMYIAGIGGNIEGFDCSMCTTSLWTLGASTAAFIVSAIINSLVNESLGCMFKKNPNGKTAYVVRTYVSTALGQFLDNLIFAFLFSYFFFPRYENYGWTPLACTTCALTGALVELLWEVMFSPFGYRLCNSWEKKKVGIEYLMVEEALDDLKVSHKGQVKQLKQTAKVMKVTKTKGYKLDKQKLDKAYLKRYDQLLSYNWALGAWESGK